MKAIYCPKYGSPDVLEVRDVEKPTPKDNEVLIKVHAASVTAADSMMRKGDPFYGRLFIGLTKPKYPILGTGFAGEIEMIGKDVQTFNIGDQVFGESVFNSGTNAEYVCMPADGVVVTKPTNITYEEAAPVCDGALTSMSFLKDIAHVQPGQHVLINGASGSLGTAAVQLAKHFGAVVTGVCSTANIALVKSLGADKVIDYKIEDFTKAGQTYDIVYDTVGKSSFSKCKTILNENGLYISPVLGLPLLFHMLLTSRSNGKKAMFSATGMRPAADLKVLLKELRTSFEAGEIKSVIDRRYSLNEAAEAHSYVDTGRKKGNIVLSLVEYSKN